MKLLIPGADKIVGLADRSRHVCSGLSQAVRFRNALKSPVIMLQAVVQSGQGDQYVPLVVSGYGGSGQDVLARIRQRGASRIEEGRHANPCSPLV